MKQTTSNGKRSVAVWAIVAAASLVRLVYGVLVNDPLGGPDADTYHAAGVVLARDGLLASDVPGVPYWPAGYPIFVALHYALAGPSPKAVVATQVLLLAVATLAAHAFATRHFGRRVGSLTLALLSTTPALIAAPTYLMYEVPMATALILGCELLSRATVSVVRLRCAAAAGLILGVAGAFQPKALFAAGMCVAIVAWHLRSLAVVGVLLTTLAVAPLLVVARNAAAVDLAVLSANSGAATAAGLHDDATGTYAGVQAPPCHLSADPAEKDRQLLRCALRWAREHPRRAAVLGITKAWYFWSPLAGREHHKGVWYHAFDARRLAPSAIAESDAFDRVTVILRTLWTSILVALVGIGAAEGLRQKSRRWPTLLVLAPILVFLAITMVTLGDPRFRIPVMPLYFILTANAVVAIQERFFKRRPPHAPEP